VPDAPPRPTLPDIVQARLAWLRLRRAKATVDFYAYAYQALTQYLAGTAVERRADHWRAERADAYALWLGSRQVNGVTVRHYLAALRSLLNWAARQGKLRCNPLDRYELPEGEPDLVPGYAVEEISGMLAACPADRRGRRDYAVLTFGYDTGVRTSELAALQIGDVDLARGTAVIRRGKGGRGRIATLGPTTAAALRRYLEGDHRAPGDSRAPLFEGAAGKPLGCCGGYGLVKKRALAAGVEGRKGLHRLRHSCAIQHLLHGGNARTTQEQLGRADLAMVERCSAGLRMEARPRQWQRTSPVERRLRCQKVERWPRRPLPGRRVGTADPARAGGHAGDVARCQQAGMDGWS
jgi:integrase/recombinase XerD